MIDDIQSRIVEIQVSLKTNDTYAAVEKLKAEELRLSNELVPARKLAADLATWLSALQYKEPVSNQAGFDRLKKHSNDMEAAQTSRP